MKQTNNLMDLPQTWKRRMSRRLDTRERMNLITSTRREGKEGWVAEHKQSEVCVKTQQRFGAITDEKRQFVRKGKEKEGAN